MSLFQIFSLLGLLVTFNAPIANAAPQGPGIDAIEQFRKGKPKPPVVQNRFFLKSSRFEIAPVFGYVPNNPFARRFVFGTTIGYHFTEQLSAQAMINYSPDLGTQDLKGLTKTLVRIARTGTGDAEFQQPLDKVTLSFSAVAVWSPLYGKINLIGEKVVNFDFYMVGGFGLNVKSNYAAQFDNSVEGGEVKLLETGNDPGPGPVIGTGTNFFINQTMALKLDARFNFYLGDTPQYDPDVPPTGKRLYNNFVLATGVSFFFPRMKPRVYVY